VVAKRRDQRDERSLEHRFPPGLHCRLTIVLAAIGFNSAGTSCDSSNGRRSTEVGVALAPAPEKP
jgi:hypothetical protein